MVAHHRDFPNFNSLPDDVADELGLWAERSTPYNLPQRHAQLFGWRPHVPTMDVLDYEAREDEANRLRREAIRDVLDAHAWQGCFGSPNTATGPIWLVCLQWM